MKICAIICEYNPFHNGHRYLLQKAKELSAADAILCLMSGNFVQRGEAAVLEKHQRAKHALLCGADMVLELPTIFATSNAEIFAKGAISLLSKIPDVTHLAFGAELADKNAFLASAKALLTEPDCVSKTVKELTASGVGYAKAISQARASVATKELFESPNNILGIEYTKAILEQHSTIEILPIQRLGSGYSDTQLSNQFASATAIRTAVFENPQNDLSMYLPDCVMYDLKDFKKVNLDLYEKLSILQKSPQQIAETLDCTEGLENAFLKAATERDTLEAQLCSPRYTSARIRRIALQNLLGIKETLIRQALSSPLYLTPLAYKKNTELLSALSKSDIPFLSSGKAKGTLSSVALECYQLDELASKIFAALNNTKAENPIFIQ